jgi:hypothetical protein
MKPIYVETFVKGSIADLWQLTQEPKAHERWDLRFSAIDYLPRADQMQPQRFRYTTRIGFGLHIAGEGETVGSHANNGLATSALKFWSADPKSLIEHGSGYWQYAPEPGGVRFLTRYDYRVRFGGAGRWVDVLLFRPLMGWATAWSFDRLRLWIEHGIPPEATVRHAVAYAVARLGVAFVWIYQGLAPKLLAMHPDEQWLLQQAGVDPAHVMTVLLAVGWAEIAFGVVMLWLWRAKWPLWLTILLMVAALSAVAQSAPGQLVAAFNPVSLNLLMAALAGIAILLNDVTPFAHRCRRRPARRHNAFDL